MPLRCRPEPIWSEGAPCRGTGAVSKQLDVEPESFEDPDFYDQLHRARDRGVLHFEGAAGSLVELT
jgi:hypothetical protein